MDTKAVRSFSFCSDLAAVGVGVDVGVDMAFGFSFGDGAAELLGLGEADGVGAAGNGAR
ncbi:hypothetical protein SALBM311S_05230 [Streptomyces alboniger]